jgi:UDP-N-acetylglucosamine 2-epimerase
MRVLRVHAPGTPDALRRAVAEAVRAFNDELDIRLRFLSIGIEERTLDVTDAADAAARTGEALADGSFDVVLLAGGGEAALAAAAAAVRARVPLVRAGAGTRADADAAPPGSPSRGADRLASVLLPYTGEDHARLVAEGLAPDDPTGAPEDPAAGPRIVKALSAARRRDPC